MQQRIAKLSSSSNALRPMTSSTNSHASRTCIRVRSSSSSVAEAPTSTTSTSNTSITVFLRTPWPRAVLHGSVQGGAWADFPLTPHPCTSGRWQSVTVPVPPAAAAEGSGKPLLEFVLTDKAQRWEKGPDGKNFLMAQPGSYSLDAGKVTPVSGKRVMVVSDLDGTMVGDDAATAAFTQWWHDVAIPRGGVLVYNTGRSLDAFKALLKDKHKCMAVPDALISAVGTKVYEHDAAPGGVDALAWKVDEAWMHTLDEDWSLPVAREACDKALSAVGKESMHFRPPEEQNRHKVTCGMRSDVLAKALGVLEAHLASKGVRANVITSGHGDWKYLDVVPIRAGKLAALNYVRERYGFGTQEAVACGDSGNDILMLQGDNPAIVVGNAQQDLREWYAKRQASEPKANGPGGRPRLLMVAQHEALGILEGLQQWGFK